MGSEPVFRLSLCVTCVLSERKMRFVPETTGMQFVILTNVIRLTLPVRATNVASSSNSIE